jgi:plastocyanin
MQMRRRFPWVVGAVVIAVAVAAPAQAATWRVSFDPPFKKPPRGLPQSSLPTQFFPRTIVVRAGDTVRWPGSGQHTATFLGGAARPPLIAPTGTLVSGENDPAGTPFWFNGRPLFGFGRRAGTRTKRAAFAGKGLRNSGLQVGGKPKPFRLRFTRPGTYKYLCLIHPQTMRGTVRVVAARARVPSKAKVAAAVRRQTRRDVRELKALDRARGPKGNTVLAGNARRDGIDAIKYFPANKTVSAGTTLRLRLAKLTDEPHTFTTGPDAYLSTVFSTFFGPTLGAVGFYSSTPPPLATSPTALGNGFMNTGWLDNDPKTRAPNAVNVQFPIAGTYRFLCLVHGPEMTLNITVTP